MSKAERYKHGTVERAKSAKGEVLYLRYTDPTSEGTRRPRLRLGYASEFPNKRALNLAIEEARKRINTPGVARKTFGQLIDLYIEKKMPKRHSTSRGYLSIINAHIRPKWGKMPIEDVRSAAVEEWLLGLPCGSYRKGHIHNVLRLIFKAGMHYEWIPLAANPMSTFFIEGATKRAKEPGIITHAQFHAMLEVLGEPYRTMAVIAQCLGLRVSEIMGLQWHDFDFLAGTVRIERAVVEAHTGEVKTYQSKKKLPVHAWVVSAITVWRSQTEFTKDWQFVFASPWQAGEIPYNSSKIQSKHLRKAGKQIGLDFSLGWHTFRHTYRALLRKKGAAMDVQRDLMRHADIHTTMQDYGGTDLEELRAVNDNVVESLFGGRKH